MLHIQDCINNFTIKEVNNTVRVWLTALIAVFAFLLLGSAVAADVKKPGAKARAKSSAYQEERAACMNANVDRAACLREVGAARQAARRGGLTDAESDFRQNALKRCEVFTVQSERQACERRTMGDGSVSGSVEEGGLLRQTTTVETMQPGTSAPSSQPSMRPASPHAMPAGRMSSEMQPGTAPARRW